MSELLIEDPIYILEDEVPVDDWNGEDVDQTVFGSVEGYLAGPGHLDFDPPENARLITDVAVPRAAKYAPFLRTLKRGMRGYDVLVVKRCLSYAGEMKWEGFDFTRLYGPYTAKGVRQFQRKKGLKVDGVVGPATWKKLVPYMQAYELKLVQKQKAAMKPKQKPNDKLRGEIVSNAWFGYFNRAQIYYTQSPLRMYGVKHRIRPPRIPTWEDCSSFATWTYWAAGVTRDPNGLGYNGYGYTGTLANNGWRTSSPRPGDLAFYGEYPFNHVTIVVGYRNGVLMCVSHGSSIGPLYLPVYYRPVTQFRSYLS